MATCRVCGREKNRLFDGVCSGCLASQSEHEAKLAEAEEEDAGQYANGSHTIGENLQAMVRHRPYIPPDLSTLEGVASAAGYDVKSAAWRKDGQKLFDLVQLRKVEIERGTLKIGSANAFLAAAEPEGMHKRLVKQIGTACMWEYVEE